MGTRVYRYQDSEGRGPYRPGVSHLWRDPDHDARNPTFFDEFGFDFLNRAPRNLKHRGCAFRDLAQAYRWFSPLERRKLDALGYQLVTIDADRVLVSSDHQLVIACKQPFSSFGATARAEPSLPATTKPQGLPAR